MAMNMYYSFQSVFESCWCATMTCNEMSIIRMSINGNTNYPNTSYSNHRLSEKGTIRVHYNYSTILKFID